MSSLTLQPTVPETLPVAQASGPCTMSLGLEHSPLDIHMPHFPHSLSAQMSLPLPSLTTHLKCIPLAHSFSPLA